MKTLRQWESGSKAIRRLVKKYKAQGWRDLQTSASPAYTDALLLSPCGKYVAKFAERCSAWAEFAKWAEANPSPHLPVFLKVKTGKRDGGYGVPVTVAVMERLVDLPFEGYAWNYEPRLGASRAEQRLIRKAAKITRACDHYIDYKRATNGALRDLFARMEEDLGRPGDLHGKNMMLRPGKRGGAGELVILDPYA